MRVVTPSCRLISTAHLPPVQRPPSPSRPAPPHTPTALTLVGLCAQCVCTNTWTHWSPWKWPSAVQLFRLNASAGCQSLSAVPVTHTASSARCVGIAVGRQRVCVSRWCRVRAIRPSQGKKSRQGFPAPCAQLPLTHICRSPSHPLLQ